MNRLNRLQSVLLWGLSIVLLGVADDVFADDGVNVVRRPSILIILADDLGYADVGFNGCKDIPTPHIDALAQSGVRCTDGYVSAPVCSPMRAGLMTGRYQQRFGYEFNPGPARSASPDFGLPLEEVTLPQQLKKAGYVTGMVGKWHLGLKKQFQPMRRGFDEFFGFPHGSHSYLDAKADPLNPIRRGVEPVDEKEYLTDAFTREAVAFIDRHHERPFFLYLPYNAVHGPMHATEKYLERFPSIKDKKRRAYAAMLSAMDDGIGQIMARLREHGLEGNTLIFFLSDNGGPPHANSSRNAPLRGAKGGVYEGGIRVPFVVRWKGHLPAGRDYAHPVISLDICPTALTAAGAQSDAGRRLDGVDLLPYLSGKKGSPPHDALFWRIGTKCAVRRGDLKLLRQGEGDWELYDLARDISEAKDLSGEKNDTVKMLAGVYNAWNDELSEPRWKPVRRQRNRPRAPGRSNR